MKPSLKKMLAQLCTPLLISLLLIHAVQAFTWAKQQDVQTCSLTDPDLQKITDMFMEARVDESVVSVPVDVSLVELDLKLQKVLDLVVALQSQENNTLPVSTDEEPLGSMDDGSVHNETQGVDILTGEELDDGSVHNDTQGVDILTGEELDEEIPKQESLTDISELNKNDSNQENKNSSILMDENIEKPEENTLNESVILDKISPSDNKISSFRPPEFTDNVKKGGCEALVFNSHETIGIFYIVSFRHGHCANREPLTSDSIRKCLGYCSSKTFLDREAGHEWRQGHECYSCQPEQLEEVSIPLECEDGYTFHKKYRNVVSCKCRPCQVAD